MSMSKRTRLINIEGLLQRLDAAVVVRDPGSTRAAEAYEGLRKQIIQSGKSHRTHTAHLLSLADSLDRGADMELIRDRVNDFMAELGLRRIYDTSIAELFEIIEGEGPGLQCIEPAVVEQLEDGKSSVVRQGKARRVPGSPESSEIVNQASQDEKSENTVGSLERTLRFALVSLIIGLLFGHFFLGGNDGVTKDSPTTSSTTTTISKP